MADERKPIHPNRCNNPVYDICNENTGGSFLGVIVAVDSYVYDVDYALAVLLLIFCSLVEEKRISIEASVLKVKLFKRRWLIMGIFMFQMLLNDFHSTELIIINNIVVKHYNVTATAVEWTSMIFAVCTFTLSLPSARVLNTVGLRNHMIMAAAVSSMGSWLKVLAVTPSRFYLLMIGQVLCAVSLSLCYSMLGRIPAVWFGAKELSFAGTLPVVALQAGDALGNLLTPRIVQNSLDDRVIEDGMQRLHVSVGVVATGILILSFGVFQEKPKISPSVAEAVSAAQVTQDGEAFDFIWRTLRTIFRRPGFVLATLILLLANGVYVAISTLLNEIVLFNFPGARIDAGNIGFLIVICGSIGSATAGHILDRTHKFKEQAIALTIAGVITTTLFLFSLKFNHIELVYVGAMLMGSSLLSVFSVAIQIAVEVTYPAPDSVTVNAMYSISDIGGVLLTSMVSYIIKRYGDLASSITIVSASLINVLISIVIPIRLERQNAEKTGQLTSELTPH